MEQPNTLGNFKQVLDKLTQFNTTQGDIKEIEGPIGRLNEVVGRLGSVNTNLKEMLQKINAELVKMRATNLTSSKERISQITSAMSKSLNEIEKLIPINVTIPTQTETVVPPVAVTRGGFQYSKSKSKTKSKSKSKSKTTRRHRR